MTDWHDPILTEPQRDTLLAQPGHVLLQHEGSHLLARIVPGAPADVITLFTPPPNRRKGHARTLMQRLIAQATHDGCPSVTLEVRASNTAAITLYESLGFARAAMRKGYYANPPEDALVLTLLLSSAA